MTAVDHTLTEQPRAEARRAQILTAAADCFRRHGFHGASIAEISKTAGMSAGHIYHYFENKEAIIAGIVERDLERVLQLTARLRASGDVRQAVIDSVAEGVNLALDTATAGLKLEIVAEASRNERVASVVRAADAQGIASLAATLGHIRPDAAGVAEVLAALIEGLMIRSIRNPALDRDTVVRLVRSVIAFLVIDHPCTTG